MKILHILSQTPDFTGSGKYIQAILKCASEKGHDNFLVAGVQSNPKLGEFALNSDIILSEKTMFIRFDGIDLDYPLPGMSDVMPYKSTVFSTLTHAQIKVYEEAFGRVIKDAANEFKPDIIHSHHLWIVSAVTREILPDIPMVTTCHGTCLRQFYLCEDIGRRINPSIKKIDRIMALSSYQKQEIIRIHNIDDKKIDVVGGGYDENLFSFAEKSPPPPVEILYAGKLSHSKGVPWLLKSLRENGTGKPHLQQHADKKFCLETESSPLWHLHLAGGGSGAEKDECLELVDELESGFEALNKNGQSGKNQSVDSLVNKITVHGVLNHEQLSELMKKAHLFILPSFFEGLPLVIMEALACGCRVITTSLPGICEVLGICDSKLSDNSDSGADDSGLPVDDKDNSALWGNSNNYMVTLVELPELETVDKPYDRDIKYLENILADHIHASIKQIVQNPAVDKEAVERLTANYTWKNVFERIERAYHKADSLS